MQQNFPAYDWAYMNQFPLEDFKRNRTLGFATVLYFYTDLPLRQSIDSLEKYFSGERLQTLKADAIVCALTDNDYAPQKTGAPEIIEDFIRNCPDSVLIAEVQSNIKREEKILAEGQEVDFTFQNRRGQAVKLSSLRGKVVLIDVWATWCGPCMDGRKYLKRIQEELGSEKLAVVALSVQENKEVWKAHIEGKTWFHEWHAGASKTAFDKAFGITHIPRYILISPEGLLVRREAQSPHKRNELLQQIEDAWLGRF